MFSGVDASACKQAAQSIPWASIDITDSKFDFAEMLTKSGAFDGSVQGVSHMPGGQKAGYARWEAFKKNGLSQYAARRNNAMLRYSLA